MKHLLPYVFIILCGTTTIFSQELPSIQIFTPQDYGAEDQNWAISQDDDDLIYVANNKGLLEYNGARWHLYNSPNESIIRSVNVIKNIIYTGCYMNFGYWEREDTGRLTYVSLSDNPSVKLKEDEEFWNIIEYDSWIIFQSLDRIYTYNTLDKTINVIVSNTKITKVYKVDETLYFQKLNEGIFKIENGAEVLVTSKDEVSNNIVTNIFRFQEGLLFHTKEIGFYLFENQKLSVWNEALNITLGKNSIYSSTRLTDGSFVLGTVSNGVIHISNSGAINFIMNQSNGMSNNTILSIFEDRFGNIWLALDNGINMLNLKSPFMVYNDILGDLGTIYTSAVFKDHLYLGTNQGLFFKPLTNNTNFTLIAGTNGQVWDLSIINDTLFCSHDKGTFIINNQNAEQIFNKEGTWSVKKINNQSNLLIQGNYDGLYILEKDNNSWRLRNKIKGFDISARYFEFFGNDTVFVSHEHRGLYKLIMDDNYQKVKTYTKDSIKSGIKSSLSLYQDKPYYAYNEGVFVYNSKQNAFDKDSLLSSFFNLKNYVSGKLIHDRYANRLWCFTENEIGFVESAKITNALKKVSLSFPNDVRKTKAGYENILHYQQNKYILGSTKGYIIMDLDKIDHFDFQLKLNNVINYKLNENNVFLNINDQPILKNKSNNLKFEYSIANFNKFKPTEYAYRLLGFNDAWSDWSLESQAIYENLSHGNYTFEVQARTGNISVNNLIAYNFTIEKPWSLKPLAIILYLLCLILLVIATHNMYKVYYKKQRQILLDKKERELEFKQLETQKQLIQFKNKNLKLDIENKNRELGMSTMNLIKKNELLSSIKKEISNANQLGQIKNVIKLINKNLNATDDWKLFEEAFNNADKDFLKEIKNRHPSLTSNDLRLCAYLRLNLSSKEIAPLLNISPRSVEVKRYRLRKKMDLSHEDSLTDYILSL